MWLIVVLLLVLLVVAAIMLALAKPRPIQSPWAADIGLLARVNPHWRNVVHTSDNMQVVTMKVPPGESIETEVHEDSDQFFKIESGTGKLFAAASAADIEGGKQTPGRETMQSGKVYVTPLHDDVAVVVPRGCWHRVYNDGKVPLALYTIYSPPHHPRGKIDKTK
jgi:mannose-6-phosphate isomerase-like protein (cupin superfamily)